MRGQLPLLDPDGHVAVKVSAASARLRFQGCSPDYIQSTCHAACCHVASSPQGTVVRVEPDQQAMLERRGATVVNGIIQTVNRRCVFIHPTTSLCTLHGSEAKPRSCIPSPFMLSANDTLVVRNRYKMLICYKAAPALPAYVAFRSSLNLIFGVEEAARIAAHLDAGGGDLYATMDAARYRFLHAVHQTWATLRGASRS